ncbi:MAG: hypothetical protein MUC95_01350 [Spirochaetes bacterium]|nr:hypothetical protein [Spirochaetota bacterium]
MKIISGGIPATASGIGAANMALQDPGKKQCAPMQFPGQYVKNVKGSE